MQKRPWCYENVSFGVDISAEKFGGKYSEKISKYFGQFFKKFVIIMIV